jgi:hypothetical protein
MGRRAPGSTTSRSSTEHRVTRDVILPSGQEATIELRYEVLEPLQVNGTYAWMSINGPSVRDGGVYYFSGPGHDLAKALATALELLRENC